MNKPEAAPKRTATEAYTQMSRLGKRRHSEEIDQVKRAIYQHLKVRYPQIYWDWNNWKGFKLRKGLGIYITKDDLLEYLLLGITLNK